MVGTAKNGTLIALEKGTVVHFRFGPKLGYNNIRVHVAPSEIGRDPSGAAPPRLRLGCGLRYTS